MPDENIYKKDFGSGSSHYFNLNPLKLKTKKVILLDSSEFPGIDSIYKFIGLKRPYKIKP